MTRPRFNPRVETLEDRLAPATFTVTSTANGGSRFASRAIVSANAAAGPDIIDFAIPGTGLQRINLLPRFP